MVGDAALEHPFGLLDGAVDHSDLDAQLADLGMVLLDLLRELRATPLELLLALQQRGT